MSITMDSRELGAPPRFRTLKWVTGSILVVGGAVGLMLNNSAAQSRVRALSEDPALYAAQEPMAASAPEAVIAPAQAEGGRVVFSMRQVENIPPPDPFEPVAAPRQTPQALVIETAPQAPERTQQAAARPAAAPAAEAALPAGAPRPEELSVSGIVQGDPPLAVVEYQGQSLFLKIGDKVADSWRLVEIRERSALFTLGPRRVEVPIKGGSSE